MDPENLQKPWSTEAILDLLEKVRRHEVLWKIKHPQYHKKSMKRSIFEQICKELKMEHPDLYLMTTGELYLLFPLSNITQRGIHLMLFTVLKPELVGISDK